MAGITLEIAQAQLDKYLAAETAVLSGQEYRIGERLLKRANLAEIQGGIDLWNRRVQALSMRSTTGRVVSVRPGW